MFVWRLSSELQQSMHDRMCELRPVSATTGSVGMDTTGDVGRRGTAATTAASSGGSGRNGGDRPSDTAAAKVRYKAGFYSVLFLPAARFC